ncbi:MAG: neutral/alkaline non-lysosomal ceramidase N-terminal domain-containing protein [Verrucomicrobia bacterium]|nr:neutral/alkaline non-lysosomal ceramidase N-terminal domain-containing protein [Verrucomicrobiota bacterium]MDA1068927.1 neutral/alkaline non-lysosomal ceramidase N-terminal domain-containing protein [Verrucomicrobiota bacterium]
MTSLSFSITRPIPCRPNTVRRWLKQWRFTWAIGLCVCSIGFTQVQASLQAGAATVDITPKEWPIYLRGGYDKKEAYTAHDPLYARAIVLQNGDTRLAIVIVDSCMVRRTNFDLAKQQASQATGIPMSNMLTAATHTHSAPHDYARYNTEPEHAYVRQLINGIAQSIIQANAALQPAEIGYASSPEASEVFNRRWFLDPSAMPANPFGDTTELVKMNPGTSNPALKHPAGPTDPEVSVLSVRTKAGRPIALLANYSLHYVGKTPDGEVSADYFGEFARLIANRLEREKPVPGFVGILSNGTSGDVNNLPFGGSRPNRETFEQIRLVAAKVADAAYNAYDTIKHTSDLSLNMLQREITLDRRVPTEAQVAQTKATLKKSANGAHDNELPRLAAIYAQRVLDFSEECKVSETVDILVQTIRIGDLAICSSPFETFAETGLRLKRQSPFPRTFTIELANGAEGYLPTPGQHKLGGYETWLPVNRVEFAASEKLVRELLKMLDELKD